MIDSSTLKIDISYNRVTHAKVDAPGNASLADRPCILRLTNPGDHTRKAPPAMHILASHNPTPRTTVRSACDTLGPQYAFRSALSTLHDVLGSCCASDVPPSTLLYVKQCRACALGISLYALPLLSGYTLSYRATKPSCTMERITARQPCWRAI
jgi:hypothetical protein